MAVSSLPTAPSTTSSAGGETFSSGDIFVLTIKIVGVIIAIILIVLLTRYISNKIQRLLFKKGSPEHEQQKVAYNMVKNILLALVVVTLAMVGIQSIGLDGSVLMFGISLGIGVACMDMIGNMFAGLFLITNKEFKLKNIIEVKHKGKIYFGRLENITMRYTVVRLLSRERVVFPNLYMILNPIITFDSDPIVKLQFTMNIHANTPLPWGLQVVHEAINSVEFVLSKEHTLVNIQSMQDNMIELLIYFYYNPQTGMLRKRAIGQVQEAIFLACKREGIIIPYPHHVLTIDPQESELATMMIGVARHHHHAT